MSAHASPKLPWYAWLWPGVPQLWVHGSPLGLVVALGFGWWLSLLLATQLVWTEFFPTPAIARMLGWTTGLGWIFAVWKGWRSFHYPLLEVSPGPGQDLFPVALGEYLRGNWLDAEQLLRKLLRQDEADVDARVLLASTLRRSGQPAAALGELEQAGRFDRAVKWEFEFHRLSLHLSKQAKSAESTQSDLLADDKLSRPAGTASP